MEGLYLGIEIRNQYSRKEIKLPWQSPHQTIGDTSEKLKKKKFNIYVNPLEENSKSARTASTAIINLTFFPEGVERNPLYKLFVNII